MAKATGRLEARASVRYVRMSASKARFVLDLIRGRHLVEARRVLEFTPRRAARHIAKVLNAAAANADRTLRVPAESLVVARCWADEGPTLRRWQPRALGRATRIRKRTCHITLVLEPTEGTGGPQD